MLEIGQHVPLAWQEPAKINKLLLVDLSCNTLNRVMKFLSLSRNFVHTKTRKLYLLSDQSKHVRYQKPNLKE